MDGATTLSVRYNPWGNTIETDGTGNFKASFIGTLTDAATGLIYVGNGQYYDPETGRFLTRGVKPNSPNPYVPWDPITTMFGSLGVMISANHARKKAKQFLKRVGVTGPLALFLAACADAIAWIVVAIVAVAIILWGCIPGPSNGVETPGTPGGVGGPETVTPQPTPIQPPTGTPTAPPPCKGCTSTSTFMGKFIMSSYYIPLESQYGEDSAPWPIYAVVKGEPGCKVALSKSHLTDPTKLYDCESNYDNLRLARHDFLYDREVAVGPNARDGAGVCVQGTGKLNTGEYISCVDSKYVLDEDVRFDW